MSASLAPGRLPPLAQFALAAGALWGGFLAIEGALGRLPLALTDPRDFRIAIVNLGLLAYLPAARALVVEGARARVRELADFVSATPEETSALASVCGVYPLRLETLVFVAGAILGLVVPIVLPTRGPAPYDLQWWTPEVIWHRIAAPLIGAFFARLILATIAESARLSALAARIQPFDLLDLRCAAPFTRMGLRNAFVATGLWSFAALFLLDEGFGRLVGFLVTIAAGVAAAGFVLPLRGLRDRIRAQKRQEVARCDEALRRARDGLLVGGGSRDGRLADLAAYRARLESVHEWPFDTPTALRFALYLALPLGSWLGGALVERLVGAVFR